MNVFSTAPFVRLLLPFLSGIITAIYIHPAHPRFILYPLAFTGLLLVTVLLGKKGGRPPFHYLLSVLISVLLFQAGFLICLFHTGVLRKNHVSHISPDADSISLKIVSATVEKQKTWRMIAEAERVQLGGKSIRVSGLVLLYLRKDSASARLEAGDELAVYGRPEEIPGPVNPGMFDYKKYMENRNVNVQVFAGVKQWKLMRHPDQSGLIRFCTRCRESLLRIFREQGISGQEYAVGSALLLGYEDKLDPELMTAYANAGVLHILSVSGLHVAIVYLVLHAMLFFMNKFPGGIFLKAFLLLAFLWGYAALSGLSPSVMRSAAMFSFIVLSKTFKRTGNMVNTLAVSVFLLLSLQPYLILDPGFQLSYLAVLGIVLFEPIFSSIWSPGSWTGKQIWSLCCVSAAAQAATFPISLYYFHQFPVYFLFTNLLVIPLSTVAMYAGILLLVCFRIPLLSSWASWIFNHTLLWLNSIVEASDRIPGAVLGGINLTITQTLLLYLLLICIYAFFRTKKIRYTYSFLGILIGLVFIHVQNRQAILRQNRFVVFSLPGETALAFVHQRSESLFADSGILRNKFLKKFYVTPFTIQKNINHETAYTSVKGLVRYSFRGKTVLALNGIPCPQAPLKADYLIISKNAEPGPWDIDLSQIHQLIIDNSCKIRVISRWEKLFAKSGQKAWIISKQGAYSETFRN